MALSWKEWMEYDRLFQAVYISPERILKLRQNLHWTQEQFAKRLGVRTLTISRWEHGHIRPHLKNVHKLLRLEEEVAAGYAKIAVEMAKQGEQKRGVA